MLLLPVACNRSVLEPKARLCVCSAHSFLWFMPEQPHQLPAAAADASHSAEEENYTE